MNEKLINHLVEITYVLDFKVFLCQFERFIPWSKCQKK